VTTLPRSVQHWPAEALHELEERAAMRVEHFTRPLTAAEDVEVRAWAEELVRVRWFQSGRRG
jgi:hypothetical protein